jgi:hypothetical protein
VTCSKIFLHIVNTRWVCSLIHIWIRRQFPLLFVYKQERLISLIGLYFRVVLVNTTRPDGAFLFVVWFIHWKHMIRPFLFIDKQKRKLSAARLPLKLERLPPSLEKIWIFGVKSWFFTRNIPIIFASPSVRRIFFKCAPPTLTWNPGSAPVGYPGFIAPKTLN